jgi:hypothetical protein
MLTGGVSVAAERERAEHAAVRGPRPSDSRAAQGERRKARRREYEKTMHEAPSFILCAGNAANEG